MSTYFVTGIDTEAGKTIACGLMARFLRARGGDAFTMKAVQTGCAGVPEDIKIHRALMGAELDARDLAGVTCPYVFHFPASPHLAARLEGCEIEPEKILEAAQKLQKTFNTLLVEGSGGLLVPLTEDFLFADLVKMAGWKLIIVTSAKLGSINHTLLTLEVAASRRIPVAGLVYNLHPPSGPAITEDSRQIMLRYMKKLGFGGALAEMPRIDDIENPPKVDFSAIFP